MATKKITLTELKSLVKNIVKEEQSKNKKVIKESKDDLIDFVVPQHYASALIDGDFSGLGDEDTEKLNSFISDVQRKFGNANFMLGDDEDMDLGFMTRSDVDNLGADMMRVYVNPNNSESNLQEEESGIPLKSKIIGYLKNIHGSEFDETAAEIALYWYSYGYHEGQSSDGYKILSTSKYKPSRLAKGIEDEDDISQMYYEDIVGKFEGSKMQESTKPKTKKIKLSEVRQLVRKMIKEERKK